MLRAVPCQTPLVGRLWRYLQAASCRAVYLSFAWSQQVTLFGRQETKLSARLHRRGQSCSFVYSLDIRFGTETGWGCDLELRSLAECSFGLKLISIGVCGA